MLYETEEGIKSEEQLTEEQKLFRSTKHIPIFTPNSFKQLNILIDAAKKNTKLRSRCIELIGTGIKSEEVMTAYTNYCSKVWNIKPTFLHWGTSTHRHDTIYKNKIKHTTPEQTEQGMTFYKLLEHYKIKTEGNKAVCPFHPDHDPSLSFNSEGLWKCWGCQEKGNMITFIRKMEELNGRS